MREVERRPVIVPSSWEARSPRACEPRMPEDAVVDAVVGYRFWHLLVTDGAAILTSVMARECVWPLGYPVRSECLLSHRPLCSYRTNGFDRTYKFPHRCGIHAFSDPQHPRSHSHAMLGYKPNLAVVCGEVLLWGEVYVHEGGYRAEYGIPSAFYVTERMHPRLRMQVELAAHQYGVPAVLVPDDPEMLLWLMAGKWDD